MTGQAELEFGIVIPVMDYIIKWTPLHFASEMDSALRNVGAIGLEESLLLMAAAGLQPHAPAVSGIERCMTGQAELEFGIVIPVMDYIIKWTPLHFASENGHFAVAELLAAKGADLEAKDEYDRTPVHMAAYKGHMAVLEVLSRKGARLEETDKDGDTPLHLAASEGHLRRFLLLSLKVSPKPKNRRGKTPQDVLKKPSETKNSNMKIFRSISQTHIMEKWVESERGRLTSRGK
nr:ankyrin repeat and protein kinase domain-containing protein 1-like [Penaeus vannamei]